MKISKGMQALIARDNARNSVTYVAKRRDFRSPSQRITDAIKGALKVNVWPVMF